MAPLLLLPPLTVLLYLGAFESSLDVDIDSDREFQVMGGAGAVAGLFGSAPSYTQFANTMLVQRMAGPIRAVPIAVGLSAIVVLLLGDSVIALIPQPVVVGLLGFIALSFILDWTWDLRHRISHTELALAVLAQRRRGADLPTPMVGFADLFAAKIDGDTVLLPNPAIANPIGVRYAWINVATGCNLCNVEGLRASPFRTDD